MILCDGASRESNPTQRMSMRNRPARPPERAWKGWLRCRTRFMPSRPSRRPQIIASESRKPLRRRRLSDREIGPGGPIHGKIRYGESGIPGQSRPPPGSPRAPRGLRPGLAALPGPAGRPDAGSPDCSEASGTRVVLTTSSKSEPSTWRFRRILSSIDSPTSRISTRPDQED